MSEEKPPAVPPSPEPPLEPEPIPDEPEAASPPEPSPEPAAAIPEAPPQAAEAAPAAPPAEPEPAPAAQIRSIPPLPDRPALRSSEYWRRRSDNLLVQLGIDGSLAARALLLAVVLAAIGALLDEILGLPGDTLRVSFGGTLVAGLSGLSYGFFKGRADPPGLIMAAVAGLVAYVVWYVVKEIIGVAGFEMNLFNAIFSGLLAGILGFGWLVLLHEIPKLLARER